MSKILYKGSLKVLAYHKVLNKESFEQQLLYLKNRYNFISLTELKNFLFNNQELPENALLVTFDDGDKSLYENAFPVLKNNHNIPAVIFIITDLINTQKPFWWDEIEYYLGKIPSDKKVWEVKGWSNKKREAFLKDLRKNSNKPDFQYRQLSTAQLKEMQDAGIIIANHSHTHPMFDQCTEEELEWEMKKSTEKLKELGLTPTMFAYPNGNYSTESEAVLKKYGVKQAFLFDHKINKGKIHPLRISRLKVNDNTPLWKLKLILSGWHSRILPITRTIGKFYRKFN